jgi:hypothetical protein
VFIRNVQYHYSPLTVYADGLIDCWGCVDLNLFRQKVKQGWVATQAPKGAAISIFNLGMAEVASAEWQYTPAEFAKEIERAVETLNPERKGLVDMKGEEVEIRNGVRHAKFGLTDGKPYYLDPSNDAEILGDSMPVFVRMGSEIHLSHWFVYADGSGQIGPASVRSSANEIANRFDGGDLATTVPDGEFVTIEGLGRFQAKNGGWHVHAKQRVREAMDKIAILRGETGSIKNCLNPHFLFELLVSGCMIEPTPVFMRL